MPSYTNFSACTCFDLVATIPNGQNISQEIDLGGTGLCGIFFPAAFTGASVKIVAASVPGGTYYPVQKDETAGSDYTITAAPSKYVPVTNLAVICGLRFIKLVSASAEGADRNITLACRPV